jgi:hypothetical protein
MITDYDIHLEKREVQKKLIPLIKKKRLVTLAGPNLKNYLSMYPDKIHTVEVWEQDRRTMVHQMNQLFDIKGRHILYRFGDIFNAQVCKSAFYDLDFCRTIRTTQKYMYKFRDCAYSATFSNRFCSVRETISLFLEAIQENKVIDIPHPQFNLLKTNKNSYLYTTHVDTANMTTIFKFH